MLTTEPARRAGRPKGSGRRYKDRESYLAAIHERVYAKADAQCWDLWTLPAWRIAEMLGIGERTMYERNAEFGISLDDIRDRRVSGDGKEANSSLYASQPKSSGRRRKAANWANA